VSLLTKVRGLWRFDGDADPVHVSRRSFLFMGGVVAAGAIIPWPAPEANILPAGAAQALFKETYRHMATGLYEGIGAHHRRLQILMRDHGHPIGAEGGWLMSPNAYRELQELDTAEGR